MTERPSEERRFVTHDEVELFYRCWPALSERRAGAVILLHRGHEHGGRMAHLVDELDLPDHAFYAWDARGHGRSPGRRGDAPSFAALVRDLDVFVKHLAEVDGVGVEDVALVAQSVGAVIGAAWVHDHAPSVRALVLAAPAFRVKLYVPFARPGLAVLRRVFGRFFVTSYVRSSWLTHDPARARSYDTDPLVTRPISVDLLLELAAAGDRLVADARAITAPTMVLLSGSDAVVEHGPQHAFFVGLGAATRERHVLPGFFHDTLGERDRAPVVERVRAFLLDRFAAPVEVRSRVEDHRCSHTRDEAEALATPVSTTSLAGLRWAVVRLALRLGGWFSEGLALGHRTGFDSGASLDYVYRDEARGLGPIGRLIDRAYLDQVGWRGIRQRKQLAEELIALGLERLKADGMPCVILDVAAGHGRYVLDALTGTEVWPDRVLLRDARAENVEAGRRLIAERGLGAVASFVRGDAFDADALATTDPRPTLGVVSGLYELFGDNDLVRRSLAGLARAIPPGGYLVTTCQPWHPQLELIARTLTSHREGAAWVMRRRTQAEMDQLLAEAGFTKVEQRVEDQGLFTVSLSRRVP
ncbi:MAG: alpha/beta fold hydrolase [Alphaproteobacteria bacterium]|nr:alpha/beta fold hydrolase [Alphaproteobacteria bacterium]